MRSGTGRGIRRHESDTVELAGLSQDVPGCSSTGTSHCEFPWITGLKGYQFPSARTSPPKEVLYCDPPAAESQDKWQASLRPGGNSGKHILAPPVVNE